jgi:hypothetical protein
MNHTKTLRLLAGCLLAGLLAAGCGDPGGGDGGTGQGAATTVPATTPTAAPTTAPTGPTRTGGPVTVVGTVAEGVEPGCLLLEAGSGSFLLVGGDRAELRPGRRVAVTGRVDRSLLSTCQQGEPLVVAKIEPAS